MKIIRVISIVVMWMGFSAPALAQWDVEGVYVKRVDQFYLGSTVATRVIYETDSSSLIPDFVCLPNTSPIPGTTNRYQAAYWASGTNALHQILVGQLLAAQAQEFKIDISFEASGCNQQTAYGLNGLGRRMIGISVRSD